MDHFGSQEGTWHNDTHVKSLLLHFGHADWCFEVHGALHNMFKHTFDKPSSSLPPWNLPKISLNSQLPAISYLHSTIQQPTHPLPPPQKKKLKEINTPLAFLSSKDILGNLETLRWSGGLPTFTSLSESQRDLGEPASGGWRWWWRRHLFFAGDLELRGKDEDPMTAGNLRYSIVLLIVWIVVVFCFFCHHR